MARGAHRNPAGPRRALLMSAAALLVAAVVAIVLITTTADSGSNSPHAGATPAGPATASSTGSSAVSTVPSTTPTGPPTVQSLRPAVKPPTLAITVIGRASYVEVRLPNGATLVAATFRHGRRLSFRQPTLDVVIGDAGAVRLAVNGATRSPAGRPGQVLRFRVQARR